MTDLFGFHYLQKSYFRLVDKIVRYKHHITFISTYLKYGFIPKGFRMNFHNNMNTVSHKVIIHNCSVKLMVKTVGFYKNELIGIYKRIHNIFMEIKSGYPHKINYILHVRRNKEASLNRILSKRRDDKYKRDEVDKVWFSASKISPDKIKEKILSGANIPSHDPIVLTPNTDDAPKALMSLCNKGPSFIPTPNHFDWLQVQKDFDKFANAIRAKVFFSNQNNHRNTPPSEKSFPTSPRKPSKWSAPKSSIPAVETFLSLVETEIFKNTKPNRVNDNLTKEERSQLRSWRKDNLFNTDSNLIMRLQDKGNRFIFVDKAIDIEKAEEQIARSSFEKIDHDPTSSHIKIVSSWADRWHQRGEICAGWKFFIINNSAQPGKNSTLYKTHKTGTPVRLLTTGCNTAIENLSKYIETVCSPLALNVPTRIRDTSHILDIIDGLNSTGLPNNCKLVSFDIINMFPSIDNKRGIEAVRHALDSRKIKSPSTKCIIEALNICLYRNNSVFGKQNLLQINGTATGAPNSCSLT